MQDSIEISNKYRYKWWVLSGLGMAMIVLNLDLTIVNLAVPVLGKEFNASLSLLEWIVNLYTLTFAAFVIITGKIADKYGHKRIYLYGITLFLLGSTMCGLASTPYLLLLGRFIQGLGMAGTFGMVFLLATQSFPPNKGGVAVGILIIFTGLGQALGPTLGGFLVEYWSWRWIFLINIPFCLVSILLIVIFCRRSPSIGTLKIHLPTAILLIISFFLVTGALNESQRWGFSNRWFLTLFISGSLLLLFVIFWQKFLKHPLLNFKLFKNRAYCAVNLIRPLFQFSFSGFIFILPLYLQNGLEYSTSETGLILLIMTVMIAITSPIVGKINDRVGPTKPIFIAQILAVFGYFLVSLVGVSMNWYLMSTGLVLIGINIGTMFSATNFLATVSLPSSQKGVGFGIFTANAFLSTSIGVAILGYLLSSVSVSSFETLLNQNPEIEFPSLSRVDLVHFVNGSQPLTKLAPLAPDHSQLIISIGKTSLAMSIRVCLWLLGLLSFVSLFFCFFLRNPKWKKEDR